MNNQFWVNFSRKDLNLGGRWWHRLFLVIFFLCFAWALYAMSSDLSADNHPYVPQWKVVDSVDERLTSEVKQVRDLKKIGEQVEEIDSSYSLNSGDVSLYDDFYCSTNLENRIAEVQSKSGIDTLYIRDIYNRNSVPIETFTNYVRENNIKCLVPDAYTYSENTRVRFLEPLGSNSLYGKNLVFYEKSNFLTAFYVFKMLLLVIAIFLGIAVAYYKIFLYIIFGGRKNTK